MATIAITGAGGFVGRHLARRLGASAVTLAADVTDRAALEAEIASCGPDAIVHLAAQSSVRESWDRPSEVWRVNAGGTVELLRATAAAAPAARVLVVSSAEVYGLVGADPIDERQPVAPISPYGASKAAAELACAASGLDVVVARPFPHTGPGQDERFAVGSWAAQIARLERTGGGALQVGNLDARRDMLDVRDVVAAYVALLDRSVAADTYNVASGSAPSMRDVLSGLVAHARCPITIEVDESRMKPSDLPVLCGDAARLRSATSWVPRIPFAETLADTLAAARDTVADD